MNFTLHIASAQHERPLYIVSLSTPTAPPMSELSIVNPPSNIAHARRIMTHGECAAHRSPRHARPTRRKPIETPARFPMHACNAHDAAPPSASSSSS
eukprot:2698041-Prymnesium_polylepis.1